VPSGLISKTCPPRDNASAPVTAWESGRRGGRADKGGPGG
jgi:hypothetical protein